MNIDWFESVAQFLLYLSGLVSPQVRQMVSGTVDATSYSAISAAAQTGNVYHLNKLKGYVEFLSAPASGAAILISGQLGNGGHVRLRCLEYSGPAFRDAHALDVWGHGDWWRLGDRPGTEHQVILDLVLNEETGFDWILIPRASGSNGDDPAVVTLYYTIDNLDTVSRVISVAILRLATES